MTRGPGAADSLLETLADAGVEVVLTMLSLPGARWRQHNGNRSDFRLYREARFAEQSAAFWRELATALGLPIIVAGEDVNGRARRDRRSIEATAHTARYEFLSRAATELSADRIALGHTRDDQAETFLLRLLRGAGPRGLAGMHPRRGSFIRPLIDCRRADLRAYLEDRGQPYVTDPTNDDAIIPRNRIRAELMPLLEARFNPRIVDVLATEAEIAREDWEWLAVEARQLVESAHVRGHDGHDGHNGDTANDGRADESIIEAARLSQAPTAVARSALLRLLERRAPGRIRLGHVTAALDLVRTAEGTLDLPGQWLQRSGPVIVLRDRAARGRRGMAGEHPTGPFKYVLPVPGEVKVPEGACSVSAQLLPSGADVTAVCRDRHMTVIPLDRTIGPLAVRNRRPGDRFQPMGLGGHKKLQDLFVDLKVPRSQRDQVPIVVDGADQIVWVAGYATAEDFRVTGSTQAVIMLRLSLWG